MQAALFIREKQELRKKKLKIKRRRYELPAHVATRDIAPFPQFPPNSWGKAAWQDRELFHELDRRKSICIPSEIHTTSKVKQKEAHRRWVRKNRIQDLSLDDRNSDEDDILYGVQNSAANLLLYVGLGTMCVGMIIAFVGTGEKGFKTMELRLIGPSLIGAGILIIILRIMLCVCPSKCFHLKKRKQKFKNSTNKLNSETVNRSSQSFSISKEHVDEESGIERIKTTNKTNKKRVSIAMLPTTSGLSTNSQISHKSQYQKSCSTEGSPSVSTFKMSPKYYTSERTLNIQSLLIWGGI
ncbi:conserved hypothetical protein [Pediculus humanus corporis]|uniref:Uncharacterized protein n=1 Tax=Pediculus humanus subsp. corporis TaxID=121224 RepID=E0VIX0_PEDHC|nr:uncharacterized protein Phum_PHUM234650 [Pediculus humanus corporis]EEB13326.1 conserved hypothetical protein [Pediculus humanus corporis]